MAGDDGVQLELVPAGSWNAALVMPRITKVVEDQRFSSMMQDHRPSTSLLRGIDRASLGAVALLGTALAAGYLLQT